MGTVHPRAQPRRLATLDTGAGTSGRNEAAEETEEIYEAKKELDETFEVDDEADEPKNEVKQVTVGRESNSELTERKKKRLMPHSRTKKKDERKKNMDSTVIEWMSRG